jgi:hypothetical protein
MKIVKLDLSVSDHDAAEYSLLPLECKAQHLAWTREFGEVVAGDGRLEDRLRRAADRMGVSYATARRRWDCALRCGWRGVVDGRRERLASMATVPTAFWEWCKGLMERENRSSKQAWRKVLALWHAGEPIKGYDQPPEAGVSGLPDGWSYRNFMRHAPSTYELKAARIGPAAAAADRPLVMTTRAGLQVGKVYMFDDMWHDVLVNFVGVAREAIRPLEMCCLDVASASKIMYGMLPRVKNEDSTHRALSEREMRLLVVAVLTQCGYRPDGTLLTVEHGTAAIRQRSEFASALDALTGGAVRVVRGGIQDASLVLGGWPGPKRGDFRLKAALESIHGLSHNALGLLPGQTGSNSRVNKPEPLAGLVAYNNRLLRQVEQLPAERARAIVDKLSFPLMHWTDYCAAVSDVYRWLDARTLHDLEGWEANGWTAQEYRLDAGDQRWLPARNLAALPEPQREAALAVIRQPGCMRVRRLSPAEVWRGGRGELVTLRPEHVPVLLGPDMAEKKGLDRHRCFTIESQEFGGGDPLKFPAAQVRNVLGQDVVLDPRHMYKVFANPFDQSQLYVCDMDLRYIGVARRQVGVSRADLDAIHRAIGRAAADRAALDAPVRARQAAVADERAAMIGHNEAVLGALTGGVAPDGGAGGRAARARSIRQADDEAMEEMAGRPEAAAVTRTAAADGAAGDLDELI